jgi:hypothetical protein
MRTVRVVCAALLAVLLVGCGSADPAKPANAAAQLSDDKAQAAAVVLRYTRAMAHKDWAAVCATRTAAERRMFARKGGSCANAFNIMFGDKRLGALTQARVQFVRIRGGVAGVHMSESLGKLAAVRDHGAWRLKDMPDQRIP